MPNLIFYLPAIVGMALMLLVAIDRAVAALTVAAREGRGARHDEPHRDLPVPAADVPRPADRGVARARGRRGDLVVRPAARRHRAAHGQLARLHAAARGADVHLRGQHLQHRRHHPASVRLHPHAGRPHPRRARLCDDPDPSGVLRHLRRGARRHRRARQHPDPHDAPAGLQGRVLRRHLHGGLDARADLPALDPAGHLRDHRRDLGGRG